MNGSWCWPRRSLQFTEGKKAGLLTSDRDSDSLLRLAEVMGYVEGKLPRRPGLGSTLRTEWTRPGSPAINFPRQARPSEQHGWSLLEPISFSMYCRSWLLREKDYKCKNQLSIHKQAPNIHPGDQRRGPWPGTSCRASLGTPASSPGWSQGNGEGCWDCCSQGRGLLGRACLGRSGEGEAKARSSRRSRTLEAQRREENEQKVVGAYIRKDGKEQSVLEPEHGEQEQSRLSSGKVLMESERQC